MNVQQEMDKAVSFFHEQVRCLRLGSITPALVDTVKVQAYGNQTPIKHVANCQKVQSGISVEPFDQQLVGPICTALKSAGFNAYQFSKACVMVSVPPPSIEERTKVHKRIRELCEEAKVAIRQVRKRWKKITDDEDALQRATDAALAEVDQLASCVLRQSGNPVRGDSGSCVPIRHRAQGGQPVPQESRSADFDASAVCGDAQHDCA